MKRVVAMRGGLNKTSIREISRKMPVTDASKTPLDEVADVIKLPNQEREYAVDPESIDLPPQVLLQLRDFIGRIAAMYQPNHFHNFQQ